MIYEGTVAGDFASLGETDEFLVDLDAGQKLTLRLTPASASLGVSVEAFLPSGPSLGTAAGGAAGDSAVLQTRPVSETGTYRITVTSTAGTGDYELQVLLNAALEEEAFGSGASNDTPVDAEDINGSSVDLQAGAERLGAVGQLDGSGDFYSFDLSADDPFPESRIGAGASPLAIAVGTSTASTASTSWRGSTSTRTSSRTTIGAGSVCS